MSVTLGCIADDYTGATDLGAMLSRAGLRVLLTFGLPDDALDATGCDAVIIALKSRSIPARQAVADAHAALAALRGIRAERFFFKYCSTFDSTDQGNIGPVAQALADELGATRVLFCPAFPENGRTVYQGHLFVHGKPLHESGMENHPLNPMTDANLVRVLSQQTLCSVGVLPYEAVDDGAKSASEALARLTDSGVGFVIADALNDRHLRTVAAVCKGDILVTGGSAIGQSLAEVITSEGAECVKNSDDLRFPDGPAVVIAGSCSAATQRQVAAMRDASPSMQVNPVRLASGDQTVAEIIEWATEHVTGEHVLVYSTADAGSVTTSHQALGRQAACELLEQSMGRIAAGLVDRGVRRLVVAGGETSGAVVREIGCRSVWIGDEIAPGVPWVLTQGEPRLALALKSGNFGKDDFFLDALRGPR